MKLKVKFLSDLAREIYTKREKPLAWNYGDSGIDLSYVGEMPIEIPAGKVMRVPTGIAFQISDTDSDNYEIQTRGRSGLRMKNISANVGTVDFNYTGECHAVLDNMNDQAFTIMPGDRVIQIVVVPIIKPEIEFVDKLDATNRGENGFGSSGI